MLTVTSAPDSSLTCATAGVCVEAVHRGREVRFQVRVSGGAGGLGSTRSEDRLERAGRSGPPLLDDVDRGGRHRIEDHAADALWVISQDDQRQPRSVGDPVDVPAVDAQCPPEVGDVGGVLRAVVGSEVDASCGQLVAALLDRRGVCGGGRFRREGKADRVVDELLPPGTSEAGVGAVRAALVDEDDFAVGVKSVLDHERHLERAGSAGAAREVDDRIALGRRRDRGCAHHEDANTAPVGLGPALEHGEIATLNT